MSDNKKTISIGNNKDSYEMPLNLFQLATYLQYFSSNSKRELKHIFGMLDLDSATRRKYGNTIDFKSSAKDRMQLQIINKALTMELFTSSMFGYIDNPSEVHAHCLVKHCCPPKSDSDEDRIAVPSNFAQGGVPDAQIDYGDFIVILEVSAKYQPSIEDYKKQLIGALKHARLIREDGDKKPIYCILINERSLSHADNKQALQEFLKKIKASEKISITSISIEEFAEMGKTLAKKYEDDISQINSDDLHSILKETVEKGPNGKFHQKLVDHLGEINIPYNDFGF